MVRAAGAMVVDLGRVGDGWATSLRLPRGRLPKTSASFAKRDVVHRALCWLHEHDTILAFENGILYNRMSGLS